MDWVAEASFGQSVPQERGQMIWNCIGARGKMARDGPEFVGGQVLGVHPTALGEDWMVRRTAQLHAVGEAEPPDLSDATRPDAEGLEWAVLCQDEVAGAHLGDRLHG